MWLPKSISQPYWSVTFTFTVIVTGAAGYRNVFTLGLEILSRNTCILLLAVAIVVEKVVGATGSRVYVYCPPPPCTLSTSTTPAVSQVIFELTDTVPVIGANCFISASLLPQVQLPSVTST